MGKKLTLEDFISRSISTHGSLYDYSKVEYINSKVKVAIICKDCTRIFEQTPEKHTLRGQGCPVCGNVKKGLVNKVRRSNEKLKMLVQPEDYKLIPTTKGEFAKVDNEYFELLSKYNWTSRNGYAFNTTLGLMHRFIVKAPKGELVDHKDGDPLNNRRENLRIATSAENSYNKSPSKSGTSKYLGVSWDNERGKWISQIGQYRVNYFIGRFDTEEKAARAYDKKARELFGDFANLNF